MKDLLTYNQVIVWTFISTAMLDASMIRPHFFWSSTQIGAFTIYQGFIKTAVSVKKYQYKYGENPFHEYRPII